MNIFEPYYDLCQTLDDINEFEAKTDCSVLVLKFDTRKKTFSILKPVLTKRKSHVDLLLLSSNQDGKQISHYVLIRNLRGLLGHTGTKIKDICRLCLKPLNTSFAVHVQSCVVDGSQQYSFKSKGMYKFAKPYSKVPIAYLIFYKNYKYCSPPKVSQEKGTLKYTTQVSNLQAASYCIVVADPLREILHEEYYDGVNVMERFVISILMLIKKYRDLIRDNPEPLIDTPEFVKELETVKSCPVCLDPFVKSKPVRNHSHSVSLPFIDETNSYMANKIICKICNLSLRIKPVVCISFGSSKIEHHFIIKSLQTCHVNKVRLVCKSPENIIALIIYQTMFLDFKMFLDFELGEIERQIRTSGSVHTALNKIRR